MSTKGNKLLWYVLLVLPAIIVYVAVVAFPTIFSIVLSMTDYTGGRLFGEDRVDVDFVGLTSYRWIFTEPSGAFYIALKNNLLIVAVSVFGQLPLGFILAFILSQKYIKRGKGLFQTMIYLPNVISPIIIGVLFNAIITGSRSLLMDIRKLFDADAVFSMPTNHMMPVLIVILWMFTGFYMIIFLANLQRIDPELLEAARIDGASEGRVLLHIVLPSMVGVILTSAILAISGSLKTFDLIYAMTSGGPAGQTRVLSLYMYEQAFQGQSNYPMANAISTVMVIISIVLIVITQQVGKIFNDKEA